MGDIDWVQEFISAGIPEAKKALPSYRDGFQRLAGIQAFAGVIKDFDNPGKQAKHLKHFDTKMKAFDGFQKGLDFLSKGHDIKGITFTNVDKILLGYNLLDIACNKDLNTVDKIDRSLSTISGSAGSLLGAEIGGVLGLKAGAAIGGVIGTFFCPGLGTSVGAAVGGFLGFVGGIAGSIIGGNIFSNFYDNCCSPYIKKGLNFLSGIAGQFRSGGVEFILPEEIYEFNNCFSYDKCHFISFEYDSENNFNIEQIIDLINSKFLINNIKVKNINEIYETILKEIAYGFLC